MNGETPAQQFGQRVRELRTAVDPHLDQGRLADAVGYSREYICQIERGKKLPSADVARKLDEKLGAGGDLMASWRTMWLRKQAERVGRGGDAEVAVQVDRRQFGELSLGALAAAAATTSETIARANTTALKVDDLEEEQTEIFGLLHSTPHDELLPRVAGDWRTVEGYLETRLTFAVHGRLTLLAGHFARALATLGRMAGNRQMARKFAILASQHADDTGDPLLIGAVALLRSRIALDAGQFSKAADIAGRGRLAAHPGQRARMAAYQAEALAAAGRMVEARDALAAMRAAMPEAICSSAPALISWNEAEEALYGSMTLVHLSAGIEAERLALRAADEYVDDDEGVGLAHVTAARALIIRDHPDPGAAVREARATLDVISRVPNAAISRRLATIRSELTQRWEKVPEVGAFDQEFAAASA